MRIRWCIVIIASLIGGISSAYAGGRVRFGDGDTRGLRFPLGEYGILTTPFRELQKIQCFWPQEPPKAPLPSEEPDLVYEYRLAELGRRSIVPLRYHPLVRKYILTYTVDRREQVSQMLGLSELYFPLFREALDRHQLPLELVHLAVIESGLNPLAVSGSGAVGLWQFKLNTGEMFSLSVDSFCDDRMDPPLATEAACAYLTYLYRLFDDWLLALAAYNAGPGTVQRAIERSGGERDYWKLLPALPEAAQNYVPAFIAATYVFSYAQAHGIEPEMPRISFREVDTVMVTKAVSFGVLSQWTELSLELLHFLNPRFRQGYVPKPLQGAVPLVLPKTGISKFLEHADRIYAQSHKVAESPFPLEQAKQIRIHHIVSPGEYLHKIALQYDCTLAELQQWNSAGKPLHPGDTLTVWVTPDFCARSPQCQPFLSK